MIADVIRFPKSIKAARKTRTRKPAGVIEQAQREAKDAGYTQDLSRYPVLAMLAKLARAAGPRTRRVSLGGTHFPLSHELWRRVVICPRTGRRLVGVVDL